MSSSGGERRGLVAEIGEVPAAAWILLAGTFINRFGSFVLVFLVLYLTSRGYSASRAGLAASAYGVGAIGAFLAGGYLADHLGRRQTIALSMFLAAAAMIALSQARQLWLITVLTGVTGFTAELYRPASSAYLTDLSKPGQRITIFALYRVAINLGFAVGPAVGGLLASKSFVLIFVGDAATCAAFGAIALLCLPSTRPPGPDAAPSRALFADILRDRGFVLVLVGSLGAAFVYFQSQSTFPLQVGAHGFTNATYGALVSLNGLLVLLIELPLTSVTRRFSPARVMALGIVVTGIGFGLTGMAATLPLLVVTVVIWTLGEIIFVPVASAYVADVAPDHMRGRYQGAWGLTFGVGHIAGPAVGGALFQWDPSILWSGCFIVGAISGILVLASSARHRVF